MDTAPSTTFWPPFRLDRPFETGTRILQTLVMTGPSSQCNAGGSGLKRINTGLSEASVGGPRSSGAGSGRLSLHIPNAYPRAVSPRSPNSSKQGTPISSRPTSPGPDAGSSRSNHPVSAFDAVKGPSQGEVGERASRAARPPRVRVFRRDSSLITIHQVDDGASDGAEPSTIAAPRTRAFLRPVIAVRDFFATKQTSSSSARDFLARERNFFVWLRLSCLLAILSASLILQLQLPDSVRSSSHPRRRHSHTPVDWDNLPLASKAFAGIFFLLSLLALATGLADYLSAERQLEKEQVDFDETEGVFLNDAHTSQFVHVVMLTVGAGIVASALWLIAS